MKRFFSKRRREYHKPLLRSRAVSMITSTFTTGVIGTYGPMRDAPRRDEKPT